MLRRLVYLLVLCLPGGPLLAAEVQQFASPRERATLIELYTSEGCSSCPPAEAWLNGLADHALLWRRVFPIALHVDYWDYIGWKDRFADPAFGQRQRAHARRLGARTVYTPAFFVNGRPWRRSWLSRQPELATGEVGVLRVEVKGKEVSARFAPATRLPAALELRLAVVGMGLESRIDAGEREGSRVRHDFVVLGMSRIPARAGQANAWQGRLPVLSSREAGRYALVAWLSAAGDITPLQVTGGPLVLPP